ncbi:uncharacterized protein Z519_02342 [Cladophialophora bantiana CBS 173.52]|uniref:Uncharacterized protein n=1 Tax=Cladophialophora bantiana (strain ATCC 10958 / CBS 173.52 / CDC B-1940 / NIH 8579) TaxID=1442370 RepID=A0A0D2F417_CLAB1|nr:uncharacterized protein Z519_02342 [Cladophialophora bantiana CBS 173.52]KIW96951.1 hypothetical protein Z519_02342 [Cladophialophora bantiana CBS 173.52]
MAFPYEPQGWQAPVRQPSWEQPPPPSRSGASSTSQREDGNAFAMQFEEVDRAMDNLVKSGKFYGGGGGGQRSMPAGPLRPGVEYGPRMHGGRHPIGDFDPSRPHPSSNLQNFYAAQRHQGRHGDADQMMQAKRRMAAQRERELRNYHQEQQYNRSLLAEMSSNKSDRSMSPSTLSEEGRRELIARQHRALYGGDPAAFVGQVPFSTEDGNSRDQAGAVSGNGPGAPRGPSPRTSDPFGVPGQTTQGESGAQGTSSGQEASRAEKATSPSAQTSSGFGTFDTSIQAPGKAPTPPSGEESSHSRQISKSTTAPVSGGMGPIGSRPNVQQAPNQSINKRTTSPLPSSLGYGFGSNEQNADRAGSANSNSNAQKESSTSGMGAWGTGSGVWGSNKIGTTSVWG